MNLDNLAEYRIAYRKGIKLKWVYIPAFTGEEATTMFHKIMGNRIKIERLEKKWLTHYRKDRIAYYQAIKEAIEKSIPFELEPNDM